MQLREDNADARLTPVAREMGLVDDDRWLAFERKREEVEKEIQRLRSTWASPRNLPSDRAMPWLGQTLEHETSLEALLRRPGMDYATLRQLENARVRTEAEVSRETPAPELAPEVAEQVEITIKYAGYINRQRDEVARLKLLTDTPLPNYIDYAAVKGLGFEVSQTLNRHRPATLGDASRLSGVTPAALSLLLVHLKRLKGPARDPSVAT